MRIFTSQRPRSKTPFRVEGPHIVPDDALGNGIDRQMHGEYYFFHPSYLEEGAVYTFRGGADPIYLNGSVIAAPGASVAMTLVRKGTPYYTTIWEIIRADAGRVASR